MTDLPNLESLYREAQSALKRREYERAGGLLRQILLIDENYKDASRLLAQLVKLRRRRWYNDPRLLGALGLVIVIVLGVFLAPRMRGMYVTPNVPATDTATITITPTKTEIPTETPTPAPTAIPLAWKRVWLG